MSASSKLKHEAARGSLLVFLAGALVLSEMMAMVYRGVIYAAAVMAFIACFGTGLVILLVLYTVGRLQPIADLAVRAFLELD